MKTLMRSSALSILIFGQLISANPQFGTFNMPASQQQLGGASIAQELFAFIQELVPAGSTILELGSGWGTKELALHYTMFSVENDPRFIDLYESTYIYAPIKNGWYDTAVLEKELPEHYDLILIDGPLGSIGRGKFADNLHLFNTDVPLIFDDTNRAPEYNLCKRVSEKLGRPFTIYHAGEKSFGVILPN